MRNLFLFILLVCVACDGTLPTAPEREALSGPRAESLEENEPLFRFETPVTLRPGQTVTVRIIARWNYPLGVAFESSDNATATIAGRIEPGSSYAIVQITGHRTGSVAVRALVWNFGRAPGSHPVDGTIVVGPGAKRRAVAH